MAPRTRVVLIHSNGELRRKLANGLTKAGYECFQAEVRADGLPLIFQVRPDLIFLEIVTHGNATWETFSRIRHFTDTPVIVTADQPPSPSHSFMAKENVLVLTQPISVAKAVSAARVSLKSSGTQLSSQAQD